MFFLNKFTQLYVEDSLGDRVWVDQEDCQGFVNNVQTALGSRLPPQNAAHDSFMLPLSLRSEACSSPSASIACAGGDEEEGGGLLEAKTSIISSECLEKIEVPVLNRFVSTMYFIL